VFVNTREQGDIGELSAAVWLAEHGAKVCWPIGHSPDWDLVIEWRGGLHRVQVKTSNCFIRERWVVAVCTRGGNQSWNKIVKRFAPERCDYLFVHVGDGRRWFMPATAVEGSTSICLGGPKYSEFEVEPGASLDSWTTLGDAA